METIHIHVQLLLTILFDIIIFLTVQFQNHFHRQFPYIAGFLFVYRSYYFTYGLNQFQNTFHRQMPYVAGFPRTHYYYYYSYGLITKATGRTLTGPPTNQVILSINVNMFCRGGNNVLITLIT